MSIIKGLIFGDTHMVAGQPLHPSYEVMKAFAFHTAPWDFIIDLGDTLEIEYFASFNKDAVEYQANGNLDRDYDLVRSELDEWQFLTKDYIMLQGNHDERVDRFALKYPSLRGKIEYDNAMGLTKRGVKYIPLVDQPYKIGKLYTCHGWYSTINSAKKHLEMIGGNVVFGHIHKFQSYSQCIPAKNEEIMAWSLGCLCGKLPKWKKGAPTGWQNGFAVVYMDSKTGRFNLYPVQIIDGEFTWEGTRWQI